MKPKWMGSGEVPDWMTRSFTLYFGVMFLLGLIFAVGLVIAHA
jgi:hypothetical protein